MFFGGIYSYESLCSCNTEEFFLIQEIFSDVDIVTNGMR